MYRILDFNFYNLVYFFAFYSFCGWCIEVLYYFKTEHKFVNRGFLKGPFCPIYGCAIVTMILLLDDYKNNIFLLFFLAFFFTSVIEYFTGLLLEKLFKAKWWDYTDDPFNIQGRVCLPYSLFWASGELLIIYIIHPMVNDIVSRIPNVLGLTLFFTIIIYFLIDLSFTLLSLSQFNMPQYPLEFAFNKSNFLFSYSKIKIYRHHNLESIFSKFRFNNKRLMKGIYIFHHKSFSSFISTLKDKFKKD